MKIQPILITSLFAAALMISALLPLDAQAMPAPINKGVQKDEHGNLAPNVDTRMGDDNDSTGNDADFQSETSGSDTGMPDAPNNPDNGQRIGNTPSDINSDRR